MSVKPEDILVTAGEIIKNGQSESNIRCSISRSYYSMYHKVLSILRCEPIMYPNKGVHSSLIHYLQTDAMHDEVIEFKSLKSLAYMLRQEKDSRVAADYTLDDTLDIRHANETLDSANRCIQKCNELLS